jgi:DNA-binding CsgD family transcriptional regulator
VKIFGIELVQPLSFSEDVDALLAWLSLFVQVPGDLLGTVLDADDPWALMLELQAQGHVVIGGGHARVAAIADDERATQQHAAVERWGATAVADIHRAAVDYWVEHDDFCSAVYHLVQLGEQGRAIDYLTVAWPTAPFDIGHGAFMEAVHTLAADRKHPDHVELLAIQRLVAELPWPLAGNPRLDLQLLNAVPHSLSTLEPRARIVVTAAVILSLAATGQLRAAVSLGESLAADASSIGNGHEFDPLEYLPFFWNSLAEVYAASGSPKRAAYYALQAEHIANADRHPYARFRAIILQALALALNGEYARAVQRAENARTMSDSEGWGLTPAHFPLILSDLLVESSRLDYLGLLNSTATLAQAFPQNSLWTSTALISEAMAHLVHNEVQEGVTLIRRMLNSTDEHGMMGIVRGFALGIHADLLLSAGSAGETLALLGNTPSSLGHALCFDMQRSSAYLLMGQSERVLEVTDACIAMGDDHCLRTLPPVLFRRAVAYEQMRLPIAADQSFQQGFLLIRESGSLTPLLNLSPSVVEVLWSRLGAMHPEYGADIVEIMGRAAMLPASPPVSPSVNSPAFTAREIQLARMLRMGIDNGAIAESLFLSPNTVKVHLHNLYRKLEVHTRSEALAKLEAIGFHALPVGS